MSDQDIKSILLEERIRFKSSASNNDRYISLSNQIQLKTYLSVKDPNLSSDIKQCIAFHFKSLDENEIHYDQINTTLIFDYINQLAPKEKILLTQYLIRTIKKYGYEDSIETCSQKLNQFEREFLQSTKGLVNKLKKVHLLCISNLGSAFIALVGIYIIFSIVLLPSYCSFMSFFQITYVPICNNYYANHWCNTIGCLFGLFEDFKIVPTNIIALIVMLLGKTFFVLFVINVVLNQITKKIS